MVLAGAVLIGKFLKISSRSATYCSCLTDNFLCYIFLSLRKDFSCKRRDY